MVVEHCMEVSSGNWATYSCDRKETTAKFYSDSACTIASNTVVYKNKCTKNDYDGIITPDDDYLTLSSYGVKFERLVCNLD